MQFLADRFHYGRRAHHLGDELAAMPALGCDLHTDACVDVHSVVIAALRAIGVVAANAIRGFVCAGKVTFPPGIAGRTCAASVRHITLSSPTTFSTASAR